MNFRRRVLTLILTFCELDATEVGLRLGASVAKAKVSRALLLGCLKLPSLKRVDRPSRV